MIASGKFLISLNPVENQFYSFWLASIRCIRQRMTPRMNLCAERQSF